jgi:hypothetical protein
MTAAVTDSPGSLPSMTRLGTGEKVLRQCQSDANGTARNVLVHTTCDNLWQRHNLADASVHLPQIPLAVQKSFLHPSQLVVPLLW